MVYKKRNILKEESFQITFPSTDLRKSKDKNSLIDSQILFGETFKVKYFAEDMAFGLNTFDNYEGWIDKNSLGKFPEFNYIVANTRSILTSQPNVKSNFIQYIPLGAKVFVNEIDNGWARLSLSDKHEQKYGFLPLNHLIKKNKLIEDWVQIPESLVLTPYRWGGRNTMGIDCSSLVQLSMMLAGINIPRDSNEQMKYFSKSNLFEVYCEKNDIDLGRGDIIYWRGHIGILINKLDVVHASASHGLVLVEKLQNIKKRIKTKYKIIKIKKCFHN